MSTVHIAIGNSDDRLTQKRWADFVNEVDAAVRFWADPVHGAWFSLPNARWQNACWAFDMGPHSAYRDRLRERLAILAKHYSQDSIAWNESKTEFLKP